MAKKAARVKAAPGKPIKPLLDSINKALRAMKGNDHPAIVELKGHFEAFRMDCHRAEVFSKKKDV
jgi:hypothetical protein